MFQGCTATVDGCSGQSCGYARSLVPIIQDLALLPQGATDIERLVAFHKESLRWSADDPSLLEVYGCANDRIAMVRVEGRSSD